MKYMLDRIHPPSLSLTPSLAHPCKCLQWCLHLSSIYHWTVTYAESLVRFKVTRHMRDESQFTAVCLLASPTNSHALVFLSVSYSLANHRGMVRLPCEYPSPAFSSESSQTCYGSWYLSLTPRHIPLSETARSKCHPSSFISSLSGFAQVTCFSTAAEQ